MGFRLLRCGSPSQSHNIATITITSVRSRLRLQPNSKPNVVRALIDSHTLLVYWMMRDLISSGKACIDLFLLFSPCNATGGFGFAPLNPSRCPHISFSSATKGQQGHRGERLHAIHCPLHADGNFLLFYSHSSIFPETTPARHDRLSAPLHQNLGRKSDSFNAPMSRLHCSERAKCCTPILISSFMCRDIRCQNLREFTSTKYRNITASSIPQH